MLTDERLKEMRDAVEACGHYAELLDEIDRLKGLVDTLSPDGMTVMARHLEQGVVITVLETEAGDTVTTFKRVDHAKQEKG